MGDITLRPGDYYAREDGGRIEPEVAREVAEALVSAGAKPGGSFPHTPLRTRFRIGWDRSDGKTYGMVSGYDREYRGFARRLTLDQIRRAWRPWSGGECPVAADTLVDVKPRMGDIFPPRRAGDLFWDHLGGNSDIVEWRPHQPAAAVQPEPEAPEWDGNGTPPVGARVVHLTGRGEVRLGPDRRGLIVVETDQGIYLRVAIAACDPENTTTKQAEPPDALCRETYTVCGTALEKIMHTAYCAIRDGRVPGVKLTESEQ